ncbi:two-component system sensor histidine kinase QseC [Paucimonas lemoignei]|uniref:histidine kinase n=1 Tax=Paucimonas lemoignei TaxID=29443 RepID=A0A4R3HPV1_PAULE|nr:ATP-binding protein [Paucimonas lemoignei]TCS33503.1 two-component system sensor histidine kinase QseC [Paucimonas lemoignei]
MKTFSIRRRLAGLILGSVLLVWMAMLLAGYLEAHEELYELADARLEENARTLALLDLRSLTLLAAATRENRHDDHEAKRHIGFQVWTDDGKLLVQSVGAPAAEFDARRGYALLTADGRGWHSYALQDSERGYLVRVFEAARARDKVIRESAARMGQVLLFALPALGLLIWFSVGQGLRPMTTLSLLLAKRDAENLEPLPLEEVPAEARVLVQALNQLLQRVSQSMERERAFTADAAHELRTPLAAIKVQAEVALAATDEGQRRDAIQQLIAGVNRTSRLVQQLLMLARLEQPGKADMQTVDLSDVAAESVARFADEAMRRDMEPELKAESGCLLQGNPVALAMLVDNLLDNAVKYGRAGGNILVSVASEGGGVALRVCDDGPGVTPQDRLRLADRFFRVSGSNVEGSGLGLSLVERIAQQYGGDVSFGPGLGGHGLGVTVKFSALSDAQSSGKKI